MEGSGNRYPQSEAGAAIQDPRGASQTLNAADLIVVLRRRIMLIAAIVVGMTAFSFIIAANMTPQYKASAIILLNTEDTPILQPQAAQATHRRDQAILIDTQIRVLRSRSFARAAVDELKLRDDPVFARSEPQESLFGNVVGFMREATYGQLMAASNDSEPNAEVEELLEEALASLEPDGPLPNDPVTIRALSRFQGGLEVAQEGRSSTISVSYRSSAPELSADMANRVSKFYVENALANKKQSANRAADWLKTRLEELRGQVIESENAVAEYRAKNRLVKDSQLSLDDQQLASLSGEIINAKARVSEAQAKLDLVTSNVKGRDGLNSISEIVSSPVVSTLRTEEVRLSRDEAQLLQEYGPRHPRILEVQAQKEDLQRKIGLELASIVGMLESELSIAQTRYASLETAMQEAGSQLNDRHQAEVQLNELEREAEANRLLYTNFLSRYKELGGQSALLDAGVRIISNAIVPNEPSFPQPKVIVAVGFTTSLLVGALAALVRENLEQGLRSSKQIEQKLGLTNYSAVPVMSEKKNAGPLHEYLIKKPKSSYAEAIRNIWVSIQLAIRKEDLKRTWAITSSLPNEGKTTLATSLACSLATGGYRTVLIDLDLRNPSVAKQLGIKPKVGLPQYLAGKASREEVTIKGASGIAGLDVIAIDEPPLDPVKVLISSNIEGLLDELEDAYDFVVIDSPPVLGIADTKLTVRMAGIVLLAVRWGVTDVSVVRNAANLLTGAGIAVTGTVLTRVDLKRHARLAYGDAEQHYQEYRRYYVD
ncbi:MAG: polysaccharide biosynthesis tyrosine autokinase [Alphaproteobacteria bacterium]|nr:polysaccharide biosynthesis tyrosine autokinase [Alphaproteobacteria bacterium]